MKDYRMRYYVAEGSRGRFRSTYVVWDRETKRIVAEYSAMPSPGSRKRAEADAYARAARLNAEVNRD